MAAQRYFLALAGVLWLAAPAVAGGGTPVPPPAPTLSPASASAQPPAAMDLAQACAKVTCRGEAQQIRLIAPDGGSFGTITQPYPYADEDGTVIVFAGEAFEVSLGAGPDPAPAFVRVVPHVSGDAPAAPGIFSLELAQRDGKPDMMLVLRNDTGVPLKFDATMFVPSREGMRSVHTSTCPVLPGMSGHEMWPHPVVMLVLTNFRRVEGNTMTCE